MSYIQFQDRHGSATLRGVERFRLLSLVQDSTETLLRGQRPAELAPRLHDQLPDDHELRIASAPRGRQTAPWLQAYLAAARSIFDDPLVSYRGHQLALLTMQLNTAMAVGTEPVRLAARLHGQCEINCWVDGPHRTWLAGVVESGLDNGSFRAGLGWESIADLLRQRDDQPVVTSFSEHFPTLWSVPTTQLAAPGTDEDELTQTWETLPAEEQWRLALQELQVRTIDAELEIRPDWASYRYGHELSFHDLIAEDHQERFDRALGFSHRPTSESSDRMRRIPK
ncbi:hypothetical protein ABZV92_19455 [Streptomyces rubiginosohelvolus]|uniref:hypothetical protein n=1 Tax=Streptomyces rubiginosohelvolus TaxID=67362 RepID=UPI0033BD4896